MIIRNSIRNLSGTYPPQYPEFCIRFPIGKTDTYPECVLQFRRCALTGCAPRSKRQAA